MAAIRQQQMMACRATLMAAAAGRLELHTFNNLHFSIRAFSDSCPAKARPRWKQSLTSGQMRRGGVGRLMWRSLQSGMFPEGSEGFEG